MMKMMVTGARKNLLPNRERMVFVKDGEESCPASRRSRRPVTLSATPAT